MAEKLYPLMFQYLDIDMMYYEKIKHIITNVSWKFRSYARVNKKRVLMSSGTFDGTVFSGHPTRTTLGNTLRVILYFRYMLK